MTNTQSETTTGRFSGFLAWAEDQAKVLDRKIDAVKAEAALAGAKASADAKEDWRKAQAKLDRQRKELGKQVENLSNATQSEMKDIEAATKRSIKDLGKMAEDFKRQVGRAAKSGH